MKNLLKNPILVTGLVLLAGVFFSGDIIKIAQKVSPSLANALSRKKTATTTAEQVAENERRTLQK